MKNKILSAVLLCVMLLSAVSCERAEPAHDKLTVVATNFAMYDFSRAVVGDKADVTMLLTPGNESHDFEVTVSDVAAISNADLFVYVGGESEDWVYRTLESIKSGSKSLPDQGLNTFCAMKAVDTLEEETVEGMEETDEDGHTDEGIAPDEHVWTSVSNAITIIESLCERLSEISPENAEAFRDNTDAYIMRLTEIRAELYDTVQSAERKTIVVADRFPFRYLAEECGLEYYAAFSGCSSATEPSLSTVNFLVEKVKSEKIPAVFVIEFSDGKTAHAVADECGCDILTLHSAHNVSPEDYRAGITYADIMEQNVSALKTALN